MDNIIEIGRRQRKRQALHDTLLSVARDLFHERGFGGTTMDDIAEVADVARQTVFNHFPYKESLALELASEGVQRIAQRAHALLESGVPALEVLERSADWMLTTALEEPEIAQIVARELFHSEAERSARAADHVPVEQIFEAILAQAQEEGTLREDLPMDVAASRLSLVVIMLVGQAGGTPADTLHRNLSVSFDMLFNGIIKRSA
jgi:AcrR family transcriptional regulator